MNKWDLSQFIGDEIIHQVASNPDENPWVKGQPLAESIEVVDYTSAWATAFNTLKADIVAVLGGMVRGIEHIGSTAVPDLPAKPVIDIDLIVDDPCDEAAYVPALERLGYALTVREPSWYQHRMLRLHDPRVNLHVFYPNCPEHMRHLMFRDWLIDHPDDRALYAQAKNRAQHHAAHVADYNAYKNAVVKAIYQKIFHAYGLLANKQD